MEDSNTVTVSRLTVATAADFLRDYTHELKQSSAEGQYTTEMAEIVTELDSILEE